MITAPVTRVVGAYAAAPTDHPFEFLEAVLDHPGCDGLEVPWTSTTFVPDETAMRHIMIDRGVHVFTLVAGTMERLAAQPAWGLASRDSDARAATLDHLRDVRNTVADLTDAAGRPCIRGIEIQSAPRTDPTHLGVHRDALTQSLTEIAGWDWSGAVLTVEHCDAITGAGQPVKGFLPIEHEIASVKAVSGSPTPVGMCINWGRSVVEQHTVDAATNHLKEAHDVLRGVIYSGTADRTTTMGPAWSDTHAPVDGPLAQQIGAGPGLLTIVELHRAAVVTTGAPLEFVGVKVSPGPAAHALSSEQRLALVGESLAACEPALTAQAATAAQ